MSLSKHLEETREETQASPRFPSAVTSTEGAVQERVTAQEFAHALASLEAQREQSERSLHDTVPIGQALEQLGLTANAADILAEVQAQRQRQTQEKQAALQAAQQRALRLRKRRRLGLALAGVLGVGLSGYALSLQGLASAESDAPAFILPTSSAPVVEPAPSELRTLAEVTEGQMVLCESKDLKALVQHPALSLAKVVVQTPSSSLMYGRWVLVKHEGHVYVQGYMAAMSAQVLAQMKTVDLYSSGLDHTQSGGMDYTKPVRVRLDNFVWKGMGSNATIPYLTATDLRLDRFADVPKP